MAVKPIPEGYHTVTPYLVVDNAQQLLDFIERAFGAKAGECLRAPDGRVMHAEVRIGDSPVMIGESPDGKRYPGMLYLYVEDVDAVYKSAIDAGGTPLREPANQFYGDRSGGVLGPCGTQWWMGTRVEELTMEEIARRAATAC